MFAQFVTDSIIIYFLFVQYLRYLILSLAICFDYFFKADTIKRICGLAVVPTNHQKGASSPQDFIRSVLSRGRQNESNFLQEYLK